MNLNLASREAMALLPGLDEELIENILAFREFEDINNRAGVEIVPFENLQELSAWIGTNTSQIYSVYVYPRADLSEAQLLALEETQEFVNPDPVTQAYGGGRGPCPHRPAPRVQGGPLRLPAGHAPPRVYPEDYLLMPIDRAFGPVRPIEPE